MTKTDIYMFYNRYGDEYGNKKTYRDDLYDIGSNINNI